MIMLGEETSNLEDMLAKTANYFEEEVDEATTDSDKTIVVIESIGNSEGYTDKLETVITKRK